MKRRALLQGGLMLAGGLPALARATPPTGFQPWVEVSRGRLLANARSVSTLVRGRPILAFNTKFDGYGMGAATLAQVYQDCPPIWGCGVVKVEEALAIAATGFKKACAACLHT